jgi:hypothetical protein
MEYIIIVFILLTIAYFTKIMIIKYGLIVLVVVSSIRQILLVRVFVDIEINDIDPFVYLLLYRGYAGKTMGEAAALNIRQWSKKIVGVYKIKEKKDIFLIFAIDEDDILREYEEKFNKKVEEMGLKIKKVEDEDSDEPEYLIKVNQDVEKIKEIIRFLWEEVYKFEEKTVACNFLNVCRTPGKVIDFDDTKELEEKGIDINLPVRNIDWILGRIGVRKYTLK